MIAYFDTSALVKLFIDEPGSVEVVALWREAHTPVSNRVIYAEGRAALAQAKRQGRMSDDDLSRSVRSFEHVYDRLLIIEVDEELIYRAGDLAQIHGLRGYDAVHLASAETLTSPDRMLVSADFALIRAANAEGIKIATIA